MAKKSPSKNSKKALVFDLGGTKVAAAIVSQSGKIEIENRQKVDLSDGYKSLINQMAEMAKPLLKNYKISKAAIASAGPLDPVKGTLLNPTNLKSNGQGWGEVKLVQQLENKLGMNIKLENDAAAAVYAERYFGLGRGSKNIVAVTLGTGLGVGVIANDQLIRAGRFLHPEAGHICIDFNDRSYKCGCGNYGCAESFLSGHNFIERLKLDWQEPDLTGGTLLMRSKSGDTKSLRVLEVYGQRLAVFLYSLVVLFCPETIILSGGFSHSWPYFSKILNIELVELLKTRRVGHDLVPKVILSKFQDEAGLLGAAVVAFNS